MSFLIPAFLLGLFGSAHCVMMCGGIASALSGSLVQLGRKPKPTQSRWGLRPQAPARTSARGAKIRGLRSTLGYNVGRIASYVLLGALVGTIGRAADFVPWFGAARIGLRFVAGAMLVGAGLWVAGAWNKFSIVERAGAPIWRRVRPIAAQLLGSRNPLAAVGVGALWGLMPCGLVYAAFGLALASGTIVSGALVMAAFGLGTAPAMIATGLASARVVPALRDRAWIRRAAGVIVVVFGLVDVASATEALRHPVPVCCQHHHH